MKRISLLSVLFLASMNAAALDLDRLIGAVAPSLGKAHTPAFDQSLELEKDAKKNRMVNQTKRGKKNTQLTLQDAIREKLKSRERKMQEMGVTNYYLSNPAD